jgi:hypothetical protein
MKQWGMGIRHLNALSDMCRYYVLRNRGIMRHYFAEHGAYRPVQFALGTLLTFRKGGRRDRPGPVQRPRRGRLLAARLAGWRPRT